jgi:hypothetical protein
MKTSAEEPFIKSSSAEDKCCAWTQANGRCGLAICEGLGNTCFIHRDYYENWWEQNPPITNGSWMRARMDMRDTLEQHMFQLREGHVGLDMETQERLATVILSGERGIRDYTNYYKQLLCLPQFNPTLCLRLINSYFASVLEDFLYYKFIVRSATDRIHYAETLFKEMLACGTLEPAWFFQQATITLALLRQSPRAEEYYNGSSWSEVCRRTFWCFLRLPRLADVWLNGRTCRNVLDFVYGGWGGLRKRIGVSQGECDDVANLLVDDLWALWREVAREKMAPLKEELYYFTSHPAWWFVHCVDIDEALDFPESPEEIWAIAIEVAGPFYLRDAASSSASAEPRKKLKTGFWRELDAATASNP